MLFWGEVEGAYWVSAVVGGLIIGWYYYFSGGVEYYPCDDGSHGGC